jgi:hypothetical protein
MDKPRIFLGSSGKQEELLEALTRGLQDVAHVDPWTTAFHPGTTTLERLLELAHEVDFAAFAFARDDWTTTSPPAAAATGSAQASPRDNVVFEAGLFGGALGMRRVFILHASGSKLPSDLLGLTCVRYGEATPSEMDTVNQKLRKAIENEGRVARIEGLWWQYSLTERGPREPSAVGLVRIARDRGGVPELTGTAPRSERAAAGGDGRDPLGVRRSRGRVLHDSCGDAPESERANGWRLLASGSRGPERPGWRRRSATRGADCRASPALEVDRERMSSARRWRGRVSRKAALAPS